MNKSEMCADLRAPFLTIEDQLRDPDRRGPDGQRMTFGEWRQWRRVAIRAHDHYTQEYRAVMELFRAEEAEGGAGAAPVGAAARPPRRENDE